MKTAKVDRDSLIVRMSRQRIPGTELAKSANVSYQTFCAVKSGKSCSMETAVKIARALGVDVSEILEV